MILPLAFGAVALMGLAVWTLWQPYRRPPDERRRRSLGRATSHVESRYKQR